ncbi:MAG: metallophosphoesterase [Spirochaetia bacterium]|nr:metallophosphoesterase [Spirochaetia bacterium]
MKLKTFVLLPLLIVFSTLQCSIDWLQFFYTPYEVNTRFKESLSLTPPGASSISNQNNFSFIQVTDIHLAEGVNPYLSSLSRNLISTDAFIIPTGDLTDYGKRSDFIAYRDIMNSIGLPYFSVIGNHDLWFKGWDQYKDILGPGVYSTHAGNVRIIVLDSANDTLGADQYKWLEKELSMKIEPYCIVASHYNLFSPVIGETSQSTNMEEVYGMMRMFEKYKVNYVLMGHSHIYDYRKINGVSYLVGPAMKKYSANEQKYFIRITVSNGQMTHEKLPLL